MTKMRTMTIRARVTVVVLAALVAGCASGGSGNTESSPPEAGSGDVLPRQTNKEFFERLLEREYPPELRRAGIGGNVTVWLKLDTEGRVQEASVKEGSGYTQLDAVAVRIAPPDAFHARPLQRQAKRREDCHYDHLQYQEQGEETLGRADRPAERRDLHAEAELGVPGAHRLHARRVRGTTPTLLPLPPSRTGTPSRNTNSETRWRGTRSSDGFATCAPPPRIQGLRARRPERRGHHVDSRRHPDRTGRWAR